MYLRAIAYFLLAAQFIQQAWAQTQGEMFTPPNGKGEPVVAVSGFSGVAQYREMAAKLASSGYYVLLIDGKDVLYRKGDSFDPMGKEKLRSAIMQVILTSGSSNAKATLVGFSLGGGGVLQWGVSQSDIISRAVVFYPVVSRPGQDMRELATNAQVPVLVFAAVRDKYMNCCLIQTMRQLGEEAKKANRPIEIVELPEADHGFNLAGASYRGDDADAAWENMLKFMRR
jgi:dienelactone hydrolase